MSTIAIRKDSWKRKWEKAGIIPVIQNNPIAFEIK